MLVLLGPLGGHAGCSRKGVIVWVENHDFVEVVCAYACREQTCEAERAVAYERAPTGLDMCVVGYSPSTADYRGALEFPPIVTFDCQ
jgi:hypothetical protein